MPPSGHYRHDDPDPGDDRPPSPRILSLLAAVEQPDLLHTVEQRRLAGHLSDHAAAVLTREIGRHEAALLLMVERLRLPGELVGSRN